MKLNDNKLAEQNIEDEAAPLFVDSKIDIECDRIESSCSDTDVPVADVQVSQFHFQFIFLSFVVCLMNYRMRT